MPQPLGPVVDTFHDSSGKIRRAGDIVTIPLTGTLPDATAPAAMSNISIRSKTLRFVRKLVAACQSAPMP